jgi:type III pantothenate kinase
MQLIAADIGNSSTKVAVDHTTEDDRWCMETIFRGDDPLDLDLGSINMADEPAFWAVSSVNRTRQRQLENWIASHRPEDQFHVIEPDDVSLETNVESRDQLGRDRLIAAWMAVQLNDQSGPIIVIDAGTAVTIDWVDEQLVFQGGVIFPGADSNFRQLAKYTDALPDLSQRDRDESGMNLDGALEGLFGKSTTSAILQGVFQSQIAAIRGVVQRMASRSNRQPTVLTTGGGIADIAGGLPDDWDDVPDLVLRGAKSIGRALINAQ